MAAQAVGAKTVFEFLDAVLAFAAIVVKSEDFGSRSGALVITKRRLVRLRCVRLCSRCGADAARSGPDDEAGEATLG